MRNVSRATFERKCKEGEWEAMSDVNQFGRAEVRSAASGKRFMVNVK